MHAGCFPCTWAAQWHSSFSSLFRQLFYVNVSQILPHTHISPYTSCIHMDTPIHWQSCTFDSHWENGDLNNALFFWDNTSWKHLLPVNWLFLVVFVCSKISAWSQQSCSWSKRQQLSVSHENTNSHSGSSLRYPNVKSVMCAEVSSFILNSLMHKFLLLW